MSQDPVRAIADAILYEGYLLYPYRPTSLKNRQRWTFGGLYPAAWVERNGDASKLQSQMLIESDREPEVDITARFLHLRQRDDGQQEGLPREVGLGRFVFSGDAQEPISGEVTQNIERLGDQLYRLTVRVVNQTPFDASRQMSRDQASLFALASTHVVVRARQGRFISLLEPEDRYSEAARACVNKGVWPVLVGERGTHDCMLVSPIILYDYPEVAPESPGDLFDGGEIDEILTLRILTLTDDEKNEMRYADEQTRRMLERTESLSPEQLMRMHGRLRSPRAFDAPLPFDEWNPLENKPRVDSVRVFGIDLKPGDRVRLWPQKRSDIMDMALVGKIAEIEAIEVDYDEQVHFAVILDDDPGKDLGTLRQPGHRFFFSPEEVEPLALDAMQDSQP